MSEDRNKFLIWAPSNTANVMTEEDYSDSMMIGQRFFNGVTRGIADSKQYNKTLKQATVIPNALVERVLEIFPKRREPINDTMLSKELADLIFDAIIYASNSKRTMTQGRVNDTDRGYVAGYIAFDGDDLLVSLENDNFDEPSSKSTKWLRFNDDFIKSKLPDESHYQITNMNMIETDSIPTAEVTYKGPGGDVKTAAIASFDWVKETLKDFISSIVPKDDTTRHKVYNITATDDKESGTNGELTIHEEDGTPKSVFLASLEYVQKAVAELGKTVDGCLHDTVDYKRHIVAMRFESMHGQWCPFPFAFNDGQEIIVSCLTIANSGIAIIASVLQQNSMGVMFAFESRHDTRLLPFTNTPVRTYVTIIGLRK